MKNKLCNYIRKVVSVVDYEIKIEDLLFVGFALAGIGMMACLAYPMLRNLDYALGIAQ